MMGISHICSIDISASKQEFNITSNTKSKVIRELSNNYVAM